MPKPTKGPRLGGSSSHQKALLANLATSLFEHGRIKTTEPKARALRPYAEKLITHAKKGALHNRREVMKKIRDKDVVHALFAEIGPFFADRNGGYTRIIKVEARKGDNAPMAVIELVREKTVASEAGRATKRAAKKAEAPAAATAVPKAAAEPEAADDPVEEIAVDQVEAEDAGIADAQTAQAAEEQAQPAEEADQAPAAEKAPADEKDTSDESLPRRRPVAARHRLRRNRFQRLGHPGRSSHRRRCARRGVLDGLPGSGAAIRGRTDRRRRTCHRTGGPRRCARRGPRPRLSPVLSARGACRRHRVRSADP